MTVVRGGAVGYLHMRIAVLELWHSVRLFPTYFRIRNRVEHSRLHKFDHLALTSPFGVSGASIAVSLLSWSFPTLSRCDFHVLLPVGYRVPELN